MTDATAEASEVKSKSSKMPLILGLIAVLLGGGGGFYAAFSGIILGEKTDKVTSPGTADVPALPDVAFVPIEPLTISLTGSTRNSHLRFRAQLEVPSSYAPDVEALMPRIVDILNGYLRALETKDIESPSALLRLRAQMLRRVQIVAGPGRVNDLLIMEFVLN